MLARMKAILQTAYGPPSVLRLAEVAKPSLAPGHVMVRVRACSVNWADWIGLLGRPYLTRAFFGFLRPRQPVPGMDVAGVVSEVGEGVRRFQPGDEVFGEVSGAYAEWVCAPEARLAHKPKGVAFEQAAALPIAAVTALQGLRDCGKLRTGQHVLVNGASGGVGSFAVQIARAMGAEVTAVCSGNNVELVRSLGATQVVDYQQQDFTELERPVDVLFDLAGSRPLRACLRLLAPTGVYVCSVGRLRWLAKSFVASWFDRRIRVLAAKPNPDDLAEVARMVELGSVRPLIERRFALEQTAEALRLQGTQRVRGKSVIVVA